MTDFDQELFQLAVHRQVWSIILLIAMLVFNTVEVVLLVVLTAYMVRCAKASREYLEMSRDYAHTTVHEIQETKSQLQKAENNTARRVEQATAQDCVESPPC